MMYSDKFYEQLMKKLTVKCESRFESVNNQFLDGRLHLPNPVHQPRRLGQLARVLVVSAFKSQVEYKDIVTKSLQS